jgi:hypothetical protein
MSLVLSTSTTKPSDIAAYATVDPTDMAACYCRVFSKNTIDDAIMHVYSVGIVQGNVDKSTKFPFAEPRYKISPPPSREKAFAACKTDREIQDQWISTLLETVTGEKPQIVSADDKVWLSQQMKTVEKLEKERAVDLRKKSLEEFKDVAQLDFSFLHFSQKEIIERVNASPSLALLNLKQCDVTDEMLTQLKFPETLRLLILSYTKITDKSVPLLKKLSQLTRICVSKTQVTKAEALAWHQENPKLELFSDFGTM